MLGNERLVGSNHMLAMIERSHHQLIGNISAADQLNNNVYIRIFGNIKNIPSNLGISGIAIWVVATSAHLRNNQITVGSCINLL